MSLQGKRAGEAAAQYAATVPMERISGDTIATETDRIMEPMRRKKGFSANWALDGLQGIMAPSWTIVIKHGDRLNAALSQIAYMRDHVVPKIQATSPHDLRYAHELRHKVLQAEMKLRASLARQETRGAHYREDFPYRNDKFLCYFGLTRADDGQMNVGRIEVKDEWKGDLNASFTSRYGHVFYPGEAEALGLVAKNANGPHETDD